jgi:hypothetical protein
MGSSEERRHTFIVRIWREPREVEGMTPEWRGLIERVGSGDRRYFHRLDELISFMQGYMTLNDADRDA